MFYSHEGMLVYLFCVGVVVGVVLFISVFCVILVKGKGIGVGIGVVERGLWRGDCGVGPFFILQRTGLGYEEADADGVYSVDE